MNPMGPFVWMTHSTVGEAAMPRDRDEEIRAVRGSLEEAACAGSLEKG